MVQRRIPDHTALKIDTPELPPVALSEARLGQVFLNLLLNAASAIGPDCGTPQEIHVRARQDGDAIVVIVEDSGAGIAHANQDRIFEPFFTTRPIGQGAGLGLTICRETITEAGGQISATSEPGHGTTITMHLPVATTPQIDAMSCNPLELQPDLRAACLPAPDNQDSVAVKSTFPPPCDSCPQIVPRPSVPPG